MRFSLRILLSFVLGSLYMQANTARAELRVVATIKPLHSLVAGVMAGTGAKPYLIVKGTASPHSYAMKPSDAAALQSAKVVFRIGGSLESFLESAIASNSSSTTVVTLGNAEGLRRLPYRRGPMWHGRELGGHSKHSHSDGNDYDPHIWLEPENAIVMVAEIAKTLSLVEPALKPEFARNAATLSESLRSLRSEIARAMAPLRGQPFLVFHDAFQYFETAFALRAAGAVTLDGSRPPGARRIRELRREIKRRDILCLFTEPQFQLRLARMLTEGTSARIGVLDAIGADLRPGPEAYFRMMRRNAAAFSHCLRAPGSSTPAK